MGAGIATSFLRVGRQVRVIEADAERLDGARASIEDSLGRLARKQPDFDVRAALERLDLVTGHQGPNESVEVVIEAIPENLELKQQLFATIESDYPTTALLASNTSSLPIGDIATVLDDPSRCLGMHFFNPVPVSALVEIVTGDQTSDASTHAAQALTEEISKTPIVVKDSPGFASSRLGLVLGLEAIRMVESGVASATDIDAAMELGYKHPMGPLRLTDLVGLDVRLSIAEHLHRELGDRFEPPQLLKDMVDEGKLGKKAGEGFYPW